MLPQYLNRWKETPTTINIKNTSYKAKMLN